MMDYETDKEFITIFELVKNKNYDNDGLNELLTFLINIVQSRLIAGEILLGKPEKTRLNYNEFEWKPPTYTDLNKILEQYDKKVLIINKSCKKLLETRITGYMAVYNILIAIKSFLLGETGVNYNGVNKYNPV